MVMKLAVASRLAEAAVVAAVQEVGVRMGSRAEAVSPTEVRPRGKGAERVAARGEGSLEEARARSAHRQGRQHSPPPRQRQKRSSLHHPHRSSRRRCTRPLQTNWSCVRALQWSYSHRAQGLGRCA